MVDAGRIYLSFRRSRVRQRRHLKGGRSFKSGSTEADAMVRLAARHQREESGGGYG